MFRQSLIKRIGKANGYTKISLLRRGNDFVHQIFHSCYLIQKIRRASDKSPKGLTLKERKQVKPTTL